mgnify:CR=1 FL=1
MKSPRSVTHGAELQKSFNDGFDRVALGLMEELDRHAELRLRHGRTRTVGSDRRRRARLDLASRAGLVAAVCATDPRSPFSALRTFEFWSPRLCGLGEICALTSFRGYGDGTKLASGAGAEYVYEPHQDNSVMVNINCAFRFIR